MNDDSAFGGAVVVDDEEGTMLLAFELSELGEIATVVEAVEAVATVVEASIEGTESNKS
jgi:hypothetical protein